MLELTLMDGTERRFSLDEGTELTIGAAATCTVRLQAVDVSRSHALVSCQRGKVVILDLGSTNGTFVNGRRVKESELAAGDLIRFSSVMAQVLPPASSRSGLTDATGADAAISASRSASGPLGPTSDRVPVIFQESLIALLVRWELADSTAVAALVEWLVTQRGMRGAAVLDAVDDDVAVAAAHGKLVEILGDPAFGPLLRRGAKTGITVENVQLEVGNFIVMGVKAPELPWFLLLPGAARPDSAEIELYVHLLALATRLDTLVPKPTRP